MTRDRRVVTVVFADIVGSTAASARQDPEVVRAERARVFSQMRDILIEHGGTVEKFIGDAVMAVFGAPDLHEDDAERGVRAALAMRRAIATLKPELRLPVQLRIGVNSGEVVAEDTPGGGPSFGLVTGDPVVAGARLEQAARTDEILVGDLTRRLTDAAIRYGAGRTVDAKGSENITAWPAEAALVDAPTHGPRTRTSRFFGRAVELSSLQDVYTRLGPERPAQLITIFGEAGAGKSRLVSEFLGRITDAAALHGRCLPYGAGSSFWPFREIIQTDSGIDPTDPLDVASAKVRDAVLTACGSDDRELDIVTAALESMVCARETGTSGEPAAELAWALRRYVAGRARNVPLVLVIDDVQWAEPAVADAIDHLTERLYARVLVICLARPELLESRPGWAGGKRNATAIELSPLSHQDVTDMIAELAGVVGITPDTRAQLEHRAGGNPLYVEEFVRTVSETGGIALPPTLHGLIAARLDHLPRELKRMLQTASVVGEVFSLDDLVALGIPRHPSEQLLDAGTVRELIRPERERGLLGGPSFRFAHILISDVAHGSLAKSDRSVLHDRFGRWVESASGERREEYVGIVAYHAEQAYWSAVEIGASEAQALGRRAFDALMTAARRAYRNADRKTALDLFERTDRVGVSIGSSALARSETLGKAALLRLHLSGGSWSEEVQRALEQARAAGASETLLALLEQASEALFEDVEATRRLGAEAVAVARALGDPDLITSAMLIGSTNHALTLCAYDAALPDTVAAVEFGRANHSRTGLAWALRRLGLILQQLGRLAEGARVLEEHETVVGEPKSLLDRFELTAVRRNHAFALGDFAGAVALGEAHLALAVELGARNFIRNSSWYLGQLLFYAGDLEGSRKVLLRALQHTDAAESAWYPEVCWRLARTELELGDVASARAHAQSACDRASLVDIGAASCSLATLGCVYAVGADAETARATFRKALAMVEGNPSLLSARVQIDSARGLIRLGELDAARDLLRNARAFFSDPLAAGWREYIDALLQRSEGATRR